MSKFKVLETRGRNFSELCSLNPNYKNEVGTSGNRINLQQRADALERAFAAAAAFQRQTMSPQSTSAKGVKNLVAFHTRQQASVKGAVQDQLNDHVIYIRKWLSRQGAWFSGNGKLNWPKTMAATVRYDSELARQNLTRVRITGGMLFRHDGKPLDTAKMVTFLSGPGYAVYVMSAEGNLHVHSHSVGHYHHSSMLAGANVAGAGEIAVTNGRITFLSNKSGHYTPNREHLLNVLAMLQHAGVHLSFALSVVHQQKVFGNVGEYMRHIMQDDESLYQLGLASAALVEYTPLTHGGSAEYPAAKAGVYSQYKTMGPAATSSDYSQYKPVGAAPASSVYSQYKVVNAAPGALQQIERSIYYRSLG